MSRSTEPPDRSRPVRELMRAEEVAALLNDVPLSTVHAWARRNYLPSVKIGKHRRFRRQEILDFIDQLD